MTMIKIQEHELYQLEKYYDLPEGIEEVLGDRVKEDLELTILVANYKIAKESLLNGLTKRGVVLND